MTGHRSFFLEEALDAYVQAHSPPVDDVQRSLIEATASLGPIARMQVAPDQAAFLALLVAAGAVSQAYVAAMHERETSVSTYMGNGLAIPHGTNEAKSEIARSAMCFIRYAEPIDVILVWGWPGDLGEVDGRAELERLTRNHRLVHQTPRLRLYRLKAAGKA